MPVSFFQHRLQQLHLQPRFATTALPVLLANPCHLVRHLLPQSFTKTLTGIDWNATDLDGPSNCIVTCVHQCELALAGRLRGKPWIRDDGNLRHVMDVPGAD